MRNRNQKGFTLIELLIVVAIIGILAAVLIPNLLGARARGFDAGGLQCARTIALTAESSRTALDSLLWDFNLVDVYTYDPNSCGSDGEAAPAQVDPAAYQFSPAAPDFTGTLADPGVATFSVTVQHVNGRTAYRVDGTNQGVNVTAVDRFTP